MGVMKKRFEKRNIKDLNTMWLPREEKPVRSDTTFTYFPIHYRGWYV